MFYNVVYCCNMLHIIYPPHTHIDLELQMFQSRHGLGGLPDAGKRGHVQHSTLASLKCNMQWHFSWSPGFCFSEAKEVFVAKDDPLLHMIPKV